MITKKKTFSAFGRLLNSIATSGLTKHEIRELLVKYCVDTSDIILLVEVLDDLLENPLKKEP